MKIAIAGTRGIPARYGGFETFAEELSTRLVVRGHQVRVYGRRGFGENYEGPSLYRGVELSVIPTLRHKYLETLLHAILSFVHLLFHPVDIVILCNAANSPFAWILKLRRIPVVINVDGIERHRSKWNLFGKLWYSLGEFCSVLFADTVIADADTIAEYYRERFGIESSVIAYGAEAKIIQAGEALKGLGLKPNSYILYVSRLEPENNALGVIQAYKRVPGELPLVIVGDAPYADLYKARLRKEADSRVVFAGFQFGDSYHELMSNCRLYIQATEVGGTHPALIEAMAHGCRIIANGTPENHEVLSDCGTLYAKNDFDQLSQLILEALAEDGQVLQNWSYLAKSRAESVYSWPEITDKYLSLLTRTLGN